MVKKAFSIAVYIAVFCGTLEIMAQLDYYRIMAVDPPFETIQDKTDIGFKGVKYGVWQNIRLNRYGFHDFDIYLKEKKTHRIRIMCLGDSVTFGTFSAPYNWPRFLQSILRANKVDAEVINASMPGNTYTQLVDLFEKEYIGFRPDILLIYKDFRSYLGEPFKEKEGRWKRLLRKSYFIERFLDKEPEDPRARLALKRRKAKIKDSDCGIAKDAIPNYVKDLERLIRICRQNGIMLILSPFPNLTTEENKGAYMDYIYALVCYYPAVDPEQCLKSMTEFNDTTRKMAEANGIPYADITMGLEHNMEYFHDDCHLSPKGAWVVARNYAECIFNTLKDRRAGK